jgi:hypothetical protein
VCKESRRISVKGAGFLQRRCESPREQEVLDLKSENEMLGPGLARQHGHPEGSGA